MSQSLSKIIIHVVFSTKNHKTLIHNDLCHELYSYLGGALKEKGNIPVQINGTADHIHLLFILSKNLSASEIIGKIKASSSKWLKQKFPDLHDFAWQNGYAAFSVSQSAMENVKNYISNQKEHHKTIAFKEELVKFFQKHKIDYNPEYIWD